MTRRPPLVLAILDGWGCRDEKYGNAIAAADTPTWQRLLREHPWTRLDASGESVGLPPGIMGNSEVGHINIGSGRTVPQGIVVIDGQIADGSFRTIPALTQMLDHVRAHHGRLHFIGLLSDGKVHSSLDHLEALVEAAVAADIPIAIDAFLDGRDVPPRSAQTYIDRLETFLAAHGRGDALATVGGRYFAMDRDKRWDRTEKAYRALVGGTSALTAPTATAALAAAYARGENDEFVVPTVIGEPRPIRDGDGVIFFNFRPDRARQLTLAFSDPGFDAFAIARMPALLFATMTRYDESFPNPILFGPRPQHETFGEVVARAGLRQLRLAETEKYAHVTYFFNGGREDVFEGEDRILIPSNRRVATYDLAPEMSAADITSAAIEDLELRRHDVIVMNYANADMVGHTGKWEPTVASVETLDVCLGRLERAVIAAGGTLAITADHGNAEEKLDADGNPLTAHTTNLVPFVLVSERPIGSLTSGGKLGDVAPTLLPLLGLETPAAMTGENLLAPVPAPTG
jgi:2,3-bisphosphoglycerate-independent phosphoglycerate mutase